MMLLTHSLLFAGKGGNEVGSVVQTPGLLSLPPSCPSSLAPWEPLPSDLASSCPSRLLHLHCFSLSSFRPSQPLPISLLSLLSHPSHLLAGLTASTLLLAQRKHTAADSFPRSPGLLVPVLCTKLSHTAHHQLLHLAVKASHTLRAPGLMEGQARHLVQSWHSTDSG